MKYDECAGRWTTHGECDCSSGAKASSILLYSRTRRKSPKRKNITVLKGLLHPFSFVQLFACTAIFPLPADLSAHSFSRLILFSFALPSTPSRAGSQWGSMPLTMRALCLST